MLPSAGSRPGWWVLRVLGLATSLAATAVGAGLGPRHVAEEGATPTAVAGLLLLVTGSVLTVLTVIVMLRAVTRRRWRPVILAATGTVETWDVPGVGHTQALAQAPQDWEAHVIAFLDDALALPKH